MRFVYSAINKSHAIRLALMFIPLLHVLLIGYLIWTRSYLLSILCLYLLPPLACQILFAVCGKPYGRFSLDSKEAMVWYASAQLQSIFVRFPFFENAICLVPRLYTGWLRLWGAKVGRFILWSPEVRILDRSYLTIGDGSVFGIGVVLSSHLVYRKKEKTILMLGNCTTGKDSFLGGGVKLLPGSEVAAGEMVPAMTLLKPNTIWRNGKREQK